MLAPDFGGRFDQKYGEKLTRRIEGLIKDKATYHHEINPGLKIDFKDGIIRFEDPQADRWENHQKETAVVSEACKIIKEYVFGWLDYCMWPDEERAKTIRNLESFIEAH